MLTAKEWSALVAAINGAHFWETPQDDPVGKGVEDGAEWIFEGHRAGTYHLITRRSPEGGPLRSLGETFLDTARLSFPTSEVY